MSAPLNGKALRPFRQIDPFPDLQQRVGFNPKTPSSFTVVQPLLAQCPNHFRFEFCAVSHVWHTFWHLTHPLFSFYHLCPWFEGRFFSALFFDIATQFLYFQRGKYWFRTDTAQHHNLRRIARVKGRLNRTDFYGPGLSDCSMRGCYITCRAALAQAVEEGLIPVNPAMVKCFSSLLKVLRNQC